MTSLQKLPNIVHAKFLLQLWMLTFVALIFLLPDNTTDSLWFKGINRGLLAFLVFAWVYRDAESRKVPWHSIYTGIVVMFPELFAPYYLFKTRGLKGGLQALSQVIFFVLLALFIVAIVKTLAKILV